MPNKILFVDDEPNVTRTFKRQLYGKYEVLTANSGADGLEVLAAESSVAVVVSDFKMPGMDGVEFLRRAKQEHPSTVRIMLTGFADLDATMAAVNEGYVFRFLVKPCNNETLVNALDAALEQYRLIQAERVLLRHTVRGSIGMLSDIIALLKPEIHDRIARIRPNVKAICQELGDPKPWETETAANLCLLGYISMPDSIIGKLLKGRSLSQEELEIQRQHLEIAAMLVCNIPRMEGIANIIKYQEKLYDGTGLPHDGTSHGGIPLGARILKAVLDHDVLTQGGMRPKEALKGLQMRAGWYDPNVLKALDTCLQSKGQQEVFVVQVRRLEKGMVLVSDLHAYVGGRPVKALGKGTEITSNTLDQLEKLSGNVTLSDTVQVVQPKPPSAFVLLKADKA